MNFFFEVSTTSGDSNSKKLKCLDFPVYETSNHINNKKQLAIKRLKLKERNTYLTQNMSALVTTITP